MQVRTLTKWGYRKQPFVVPKLDICYRPDTTDEKVIDEVLVRHAYQNKAAGFQLEPDDCWLDLGGNIGTFALMALAAGGSVLSVEPEPENVRLLRLNVEINFAARHRVLAAGVACTSGVLPLYLCNGEYNKYRHSMFLQKNRVSVPVPVVGLEELLQERVGTERINAVKMDIEGMEIDLLEKCADTLKHVRKLVFEYTFDVDPSVQRFLHIVEKLRTLFDVVHYTGINVNEKEFRHFPPCKMVYCSSSTQRLPPE